MKPTWAPLLLGGAAMLAIAPPAQAQRTALELTPFMGYYWPTRPLKGETGPTACYGPGTDTLTFARSARPAPSAALAPSFSAEHIPCQYKERSAVAIGGRVTTWPSSRLGFEISLIRGENDPERAHALMGSLRVLFSPIAHPKSRALYLIGGWSFARHAFSGDDPGATNWGGMAGVSARFRVDAAFSFQAELEDYLYTYTDVTFSGTTIPHTQNDVVVSLGIALAPLH
jgi:hypothetical protein